MAYVKQTKIRTPVIRPFETGWEMKCVNVLRRGGVLIYPTETVYGLGCDPFQESPVRRIQKLKGREGSGNPFLILVPGFPDAERMSVKISDTARSLMDAFWPGPLTLVFTASAEAPSPVVGPDGTLALRISPDPVCRRLVEAFGPLVSTSANPGGRLPAVNAGEANRTFPRGADLIIDHGERGGLLPSTLVDVRGTGIRILREGAIAAERIQEVVYARERRDL